jgi:hypothetical protein
VYVIDSESTANAEEVLIHVKRVVGYVAAESKESNANNAETKNTNGPSGIGGSGGNFQRCLLYLDEQGRLFNLILSSHTIGPAGTWTEYLTSFSNMEAIIALVVLCRSMPCLASRTSNFSLLMKLSNENTQCIHQSGTSRRCRTIISPFRYSVHVTESEASVPCSYTWFSIDGRNEFIVVKC